MVLSEFCARIQNASLLGNSDKKINKPGQIGFAAPGKAFTLACIFGSLALVVKLFNHRNKHTKKLMIFVKYIH